MLTDYIQGNSLMHRLHPITKFFWTITVLFLSFLSNNPLFLIGLLGSNVLIAVGSGVLKKMIPVFKGLLFFSLILILCQVFLVDEGRTIFYLVPFAKFGKITNVGLQLSAIMALRMITTVSTIPLLMMTTRMIDLSYTLTGNLHLPYSYVFMFLTALQFIPAYISETKRILKAQMARGYKSDTQNIFKKIFVIIPLAIPLLVMAVRRIQAKAISMELRGFGRPKRTNYRMIRFQKADYAAGILMVAAIGTVTAVLII